MNDLAVKPDHVQPGAECYYLIPCDHGYARKSAGGHGPPAGTPNSLCSWWVRYISQAGGVILDPFQGSWTTGLAALSQGRRYMGIEKEPDYHAIAVRRLTEAAGPLFATFCPDGAAPGRTVDIDSPASARPEPSLFSPDGSP